MRGARHLVASGDDGAVLAPLLSSLLVSASPHAQAEALLARGQPDAALERLGADDSSDGLRLRAEALADIGDLPGARVLLGRLAERPGGRAVSERLETRLERQATARGWVRLGLGLFAGAVGLLALGGSRELLRPRAETFGMLLASALALGWVAWIAPRAVAGVGLPAVGLTTLVHAGAATRRRALAGPRIRAFIGALMLSGMIGLALALGAVLWGADDGGARLFSAG